jgi:xylose isomerase
MRKKRYESFDKGAGKNFEKGKLTLAKLRDIAKELGEPETRSGKQELYEQLINMYLA